MSLIDNIDIPVPLVSRFDLIWLLRDTVNIIEDDTISINFSPAIKIGLVSVRLS